MTFLMLATIVAAGPHQARSVPAKSIAVRQTVADATPGPVHDPAGWRHLLGSAYLASLWLPVRIFVGREWLASGEGKRRDPAWMDGGRALQGHWTNAVAISEGGRPAITCGWFRDFLPVPRDQQAHTWFAKVTAIGEALVGVRLIAGGAGRGRRRLRQLMHVNEGLAGSASSNPVLFALGMLLVLGRLLGKVAGSIGFDRVLPPALGKLWHPRSTRRRAVTSRRRARRVVPVS